MAAQKMQKAYISAPRIAQKAYIYATHTKYRIYTSAHLCWPMTMLTKHTQQMQHAHAHETHTQTESCMNLFYQETS